MLHLSPEASEQLPTRGMAMIAGEANGVPFQTAVEPDGEGSHWFRVSPSLSADARIRVGEKVRLSVEPTKVWPEPKVPEDLVSVLAGDPQAEKIWHSLTPAARWDWIRWISSVKQAETRKKHLDSVPSRLRSGKRRPCCFNRNGCTLTEA